MQRGLPTRLTYQSRILLYKFKRYLIMSKFTLEQYIKVLFREIHSKYKKQDFMYLIQSTNNLLHPLSVSKLFQELDISEHQVVFLDVLKETVQNINFRDNPSQKYNKKGILKEISNKQMLEIYKDIIIVLAESEQTMQILSYLLEANQGKLTSNNFDNIFRNIGFPDRFKQIVFLQSCFQHHTKISIDFILEKFDQMQNQQLENFKKTLDKVEEEIIENKIKQKQEKEKIQNKRRYEWNEKQLQYIRGQLNFDEYQDLPYEKLPQKLKPYFNEQSQIHPLFAQIAIKHLNKDIDFADYFNLHHSKSPGKIHITSVFQNSYCLFNDCQEFKEQKQNYFKEIINSKDIKQGNVGNCYFLSGIIGFVQKYPQQIYKLFVMKKNPAHLYGIRLFVEGKWKTIMLDASFPMGKKQNFCCAKPRNRQIWVMLLQKAWAKVYGSYDIIQRGKIAQGLAAVSGAPSIRFLDFNYQHFPRLKKYLDAGAIVGCSSHSHLKNLTFKEQKIYGIIGNHAYSILGIYQNVQTYTQQSYTLVKIRNPWGQTQWQGDWNFSSSLWTQKLRKQFDYEKYPKDGSFYMCLKDFMIFFPSVTICPINFQNKNSYVEFKDSNLEFQTMNVVIKKKGTYSFTIYQDHPRRYGYGSCLSKTWQFLLQSKNGKRKAIAANFIDNDFNTIVVELQTGPYILFTKIQWKKDQKHNFTISSYGPEKVKYKKLDKWRINLLEQYIESRFFNHEQLLVSECNKSKNKKDDFNIIKKSFLDNAQGYGFYYFKNMENFTLKLQIQDIIQTHKPGYSVLPPYQLPLQKDLQPKEQIFVKFLLLDKLEIQLHLEQKITAKIQF